MKRQPLCSRIATKGSPGWKNHCRWTTGRRERREARRSLAEAQLERDSGVMKLAAEMDGPLHGLQLKTFHGPALIDGQSFNFDRRA